MYPELLIKYQEWLLKYCWVSFNLRLQSREGAEARQLGGGLAGQYRLDV